MRDLLVLGADACFSVSHPDGRRWTVENRDDQKVVSAVILNVGFWN